MSDVVVGCLPVGGQLVGLAHQSALARGFSDLDATGRSAISANTIKYRNTDYNTGWMLYRMDVKVFMHVCKLFFVSEYM